MHCHILLVEQVNHYVICDTDKIEMIAYKRGMVQKKWTQLMAYCLG